VLSNKYLQINLVVTDYFKHYANSLSFTDAASELIRWIRSRNAVHTLIQEQHKLLYGVPKAVINAAMTRWTSHYLSYRRLSELEDTLKSVMLADKAKPAEKQIVFTSDPKTRRKALAEYELIKDDMFWKSIRRCVLFFYGHIKLLTFFKFCSSSGTACSCCKCYAGCILSA
jgi:hypothetical protein